ncbi:hypothetical protein KI387_028535, partial [Taxus chinensis]
GSESSCIQLSGHEQECLTVMQGTSITHIGGAATSGLAEYNPSCGPITTDSPYRV